MSFFPWSDEYSVHFRVIDNDHKDLVNTVNALYDAIAEAGDRAQVGQTLGQLASYVDAHFAREEQLMEEYGYPGLAKHKRLHRHLARTVHAIRKVFAENPRAIDPNKLLNFLRKWLIHHILEQDTKYAPYFRGDGETLAESDGEAGDDDELEIDFFDAGETDSGQLPINGHDAEETIFLTVSADKAAILRRCARLLEEGGTEGIAIEDIVMPVGRMTLEEAAHFARHLLR